MKEFTSNVAPEYDGIKIPDYLKRCIGLSVSLVKKVKYGGVFINGDPVHMRALVHTGDIVRIELPENESEGIRPIEMPIDIVYEDEYIIAVNKPRNMPTHPSKGNSLPTLAEGIMAYFAPEKFVFRAINRLDRDTSGIVIIAKDAFTADRLSRELKSGGYLKKYIALIEGAPSPSEAIIDAPIEREAEGSMKRVVRADGKRAVTEYRVIRTVCGNSLCEITLHTGRTHQIRVHMAHIGHPLVNDFLYGERIPGETYRLHAREIEFTHPFSGDRIRLISKADFEE
ncbi:MAG: RluA family pseudouridine synthase [Ruminococcaceae bacterium]|nr:RluA family pseudouridine synthase [Oscillospiraceae bacterium]